MAHGVHSQEKGTLVKKLYTVRVLFEVRLAVLADVAVVVDIRRSDLPAHRGFG